MNHPPPPAWIAYVCWSALFTSLVMFAATILFISSHCERVLEASGVSGACGLGAWWIVFCMGFLAVAGYSSWQLYVMKKNSS